MRAIILGAGRGKRLGSLTENSPKCFVKLGGRSLLDWQLSALRLAGIKKITIVTGYKRDAFEEFSVDKIHNPEWHCTEMVDSLFKADSLLSQEECMVLYSDIVYAPEIIKKIVSSSCKETILITYDTNWRQLWEKRFENPLNDAESFKVDTGSNVLEIGLPVENMDHIQGQYMGILLFKPEGWSEFKRVFQRLNKEEQNKIHLTKVLNSLIKNGIKIQGVPIKGEWYEVDCAKDLDLYETLYQQGKSWLNTLGKRI